MANIEASGQTFVTTIPVPSVKNFYTPPASEKEIIPNGSSPKEDKELSPYYVYQTSLHVDTNENKSMDTSGWSPSMDIDPSPTGSTNPIIEYDNSKLHHANGETEKKAVSGQQRVSTKSFCSFLMAFGFLTSVICLIALTLLYTSKISMSPEVERKQIVDTLALEDIPINNSSLKNSRKTSVSSSGNMMYYLLVEKDFLPWSRPSIPVLVTWHRGDVIKVHLLRDDGSNILLNLGDPIKDKTVKFEVLIRPTDWVAMELKNAKHHTLISIASSQGDIGSFQWTVGVDNVLKQTFPNHKDIIDRLAI